MSRLVALLLNCVLNALAPDCANGFICSANTKHTIIGSNFFIVVVFIFKNILLFKKELMKSLPHHTTDGSYRNECSEFPFIIKHAAHPVIDDHALADAPVTANAERIGMYHIPLY